MSFTFKLLTVALLIAMTLSCKCAQRSWIDYLTGSEIAFRGKVQKLKQVDDNTIKAKFDVLEMFKGDSQKVYRVLTATESATCGVQFEVDQVYLVFATSDDNKFSTNSCAGTRVAVKEEVKDLRKAARGTDQGQDLPK
jgi:hypothetical protein